MIALKVEEQGAEAELIKSEVEKKRRVLDELRQTLEIEKAQTAFIQTKLEQSQEGFMEMQAEYKSKEALVVHEDVLELSNVTEDITQRKEAK